MENKSSNNGDKIRFAHLLGLLLIALKLTGYIDWDWWIVLSPLWIEICIGIVVFLVASFMIAKNK